MPTRVENLAESTHRVVRLIALGHLADAAAARDRLALGQDDEALHDFRVALRRFRSWERAFRNYVRDDLSKKRRRQLRDLARDTGASRDLEVHIGWLTAQRGSLTRRQRPGLNWLLHHLDQRKAGADAALERDVDRRFTRLKTRLDRELSSYRERVALRTGGQPLPAEAFAAALAPRVLDQAASLRDHIGHVHSLVDETEAHEARITAKRLRYLLEPVAKLVPGAAALVDRLKSLQDVLGDLHDAQVFGTEVERLAQSREVSAARADASRNGARSDESSNARALTLGDASSRIAPIADSSPPASGGAVHPVSSVPQPPPLLAPLAIPVTAAESASAVAAAPLALARASEPKPRQAVDPGPGLLAIRDRLRLRAEAAFAQFYTEWSGNASHGFFSEVDAVATTIGAAARADVEIERKYLLKSVPDEARRALRTDIDQGYIPGAKLHERIRRVTIRQGAGRADVRYYRTLKLGEGVVRTEIEEQTTEAIFDVMWPLTKGRRLRKRRYVVDYEGKTWEIDEFRRSDLVLAEIELGSEDEEVRFPPWLAPVIEREVTAEAAYHNINLAR
jgi:CHAD domain-containing protein/CYTH domain-containing protein